MTAGMLPISMSGRRPISASLFKPSSSMANVWYWGKNGPAAENAPIRILTRFGLGRPRTALDSSTRLDNHEW
jgi:hypothetical protein